MSLDTEPECFEGQLERRIPSFQRVWGQSTRIKKEKIYSSVPSTNII